MATREPAGNAGDVIAIDVDELWRYGGPRRTAAFQAIRSGALPARKMGRRTIVLLADLRAYLEGLPVARTAQDVDADSRMVG